MDYVGANPEDFDHVVPKSKVDKTQSLTKF